jgi:hypothetical protein
VVTEVSRRGRCEAVCPLHGTSCGPPPPRAGEDEFSKARTRLIVIVPSPVQPLKLPPFATGTMTSGSQQSGGFNIMTRRHCAHDLFGACHVYSQHCGCLTAIFKRATFVPIAVRERRRIHSRRIPRNRRLAQPPSGAQKASRVSGQRPSRRGGYRISAPAAVRRALRSRASSASFHAALRPGYVGKF